MCVRKYGGLGGGNGGEDEVTDESAFLLGGQMFLFFPAFHP